MAKKDDNLKQVKAVVYLKYDAENYKPGDQFGVREDDLEEMGERGLIEPGEETLASKEGE